MDPIKLIHNNCTKFMLPAIIKEGVKFNQVFEKGFKEAFIGDINRPEYDDNILILKEEPYIELQEDLYCTECLSVYNIEDESFKSNAYIFPIPSNRIDDYGKFIQGKINEFSEEYKKHLINFWDVEEDSLFYGILYNDTTKILKKLAKINEKRNSWNKIELLSINKYLYINNNNFKINIDLNDEILGLRVDYS